MKKNKRLVFILLTAWSLLLIPLVAMQLTPQVAWSGYDFLIMGVLLGIAALLTEGVLRRVHRLWWRIAWIVLVVGLFLLLWAWLPMGLSRLAD